MIEVKIGVQPSGASHKLRKALIESTKHVERLVADGSRSVAERIRQRIVETLERGRPGWDPLKESTIKKKVRQGSPYPSKPLLDELILLDFFRSQQCIQQKAKTVFVGVPRGVTRDGSERNPDVELLTVALVQENGAYMIVKGKLIHVPARPFLRPSADEMRPAAEKIWAGKVAKAVGALVREAKA